MDIHKYFYINQKFASISVTIVFQICFCRQYCLFIYLKKKVDAILYITSAIETGILLCAKT